MVLAPLLALAHDRESRHDAAQAESSGRLEKSAKR
jgi:hypothetical protein